MITFLNLKTHVTSREKRKALISSTIDSCHPKVMPQEKVLAAEKVKYSRLGRCKLPVQHQASGNK